MEVGDFTGGGGILNLRGPVFSRKRGGIVLEWEVEGREGEGYIWSEACAEQMVLGIYVARHVVPPKNVQPSSNQSHHTQHSSPAQPSPLQRHPYTYTPF